MSDSNNTRKKDFIAKKPDKQDAGRTESPSKDVKQVRPSKSDRMKTTSSASGNQLQDLESPALDSKKSMVKTGVTQETSVEPKASESTSAFISKPESSSSSGDSGSSEDAHDINSGVLFDSKGKPVDLDAFVQASIQAHLKKGYLTEEKEPVENPKRVKANKSKGNFITYFYSICV